LRHPGAGSYHRERVHWSLRPFSPHATLECLSDVDLEALKGAGKELILLDVDNTLMPWRTEDIPASTVAWVEKARGLGFELCVLSNTRHPERLHRISEKLGLTYIRDRFKPSTRMYELALEKFGKEQKQAVMVGDQLLTDVLGANRAGIDALWVRPIHHTEFVGTRFISRNIERMVGVLLHHWFQAADGVEPALREGFFQRQIVRQFAKFCVVGGSSTVVDAGLHYLLMFFIMVNGIPLGQALGGWLVETFPSVYGHLNHVSDAAVPVLKVPTAALAILNAFYWNRRWTFRIRDKSQQAAQLKKFIVVSVIGLILNTVLTTVFNSIIPGHPKQSWAAATAIATVAVAFWNFTGQRLYAFRVKS
jgi:HAD superfamily phosphatase (TIGR01668 family)